jgi:hypothetical protein
MSAKVIQGSFLGGQSKLAAVQPRIVPAPPIQAKTAAAAPATAFAGRPPGPPVPAFGARPSGPPAPAFVSRTAAVQRHGAANAFAVDSGVLGLASGGGKPLPDAVRGQMEAALGADFSNVRVYVGPQAERIGAIAFTVGSDIYFAPGRYQPDTVHGRQLLGHELTHVVQQRAGRVKNTLGSGFAVVQDDALEAEADRLGQKAAAYKPTEHCGLPASDGSIKAQRASAAPTLPNRPRSVTTMYPIGAAGQRTANKPIGRPVVLQAFLVGHNPRKETDKKKKKGKEYDHAYEIYLKIKDNESQFSQYQKIVVQEVCDLYKASGQKYGVLAFDGGHVVVNDNGSYYDKWSGWINSWDWRTWNLGGKRSLTSLNLPSSHYKNVQEDQYEIRLPRGVGFNFGALLFGVIPGPPRKTWFQVEAHSGTWGYTLFTGLRFTLDVGQHGSDYSTHVSSGFENVGPFGTSPYSDKYGSVGSGPNLKPPLQSN